MTLAHVMRMIDHADDEDELVDESTSVAAAMPAQGEAIRKRRQRSKSSLMRADLPRNPCLLVKTPSSDCFCLEFPNTLRCDKGVRRIIANFTRQTLELVLMR
ncbi:hypothetical protein PR001_g14601 [Phytophthora rubi]|uniref:Uncharacterized protein n=1 Tax=Phytophthora rubi TaxID=129364 RepID=A0A6A3LE32_9STRA|nr:hypothetical protein PR001_g14601 [Phytophthora rubi]